MSTDEFDLTFAAGFVTPGRRRNNWIGSNTPTSADGSAYLWEIGSQWVFGSNTWTCTDPTQGTAAWTQTDVAGGGLTNPMTTAGDIIYAIASGVPERLGKGTDGQFLMTSNSLVSWASAAGHAQSHDHGAAGDGTTLTPALIQATGNIEAEGNLKVLGPGTGDDPGNLNLQNPDTSAGTGTVTGNVQFAALDSVAAMLNLAQIRAEVAAAPGSDDLAGRIHFATRPAGAAGVLTDSWLISSTGILRPAANDTFDFGNATTRPADAYFLNMDIDGTVSGTGVPPGELGGTWTSPTIDASHSGSAHHTKYLDTEAVIAVEAQNPLTLAGLLEAVQINRVAGGSGNIGTATTAEWQHGYFSGTLYTTGLNFGTDTMSDYDVADFTPGVSFGGGTTGITYTTQEAQYVKVGPKVHCWGRIVLSSKGSSTGAALMTGMPFTCANTHKATGGAAANRTSGMSGISHPLMLKMTANATTTILYHASGANLSTAATDAEFSDTSAIYFDLTYYTNS